MTGVWRKRGNAAENAAAVDATILLVLAPPHFPLSIVHAIALSIRRSVATEESRSFSCASVHRRLKPTVNKGLSLRDILEFCTIMFLIILEYLILNM
jgi:hypothetical protein